LTKPGLASVRPPAEERNSIYAIAETVEGPTAATWATELGRSPTQVEIDALLDPLLDALATLHGAGILHLAIAPEAIRLRHGREPVLTQLLTGAPAAAAGTIYSVKSAASPYQAPELVAGAAAKLGPRSDIYALAGVIYLLLTGKPAPTGTAAAGEIWIPLPIPTAAADFRPEFLQAVATSLAPQPAQRPPTIAALRSLLREAPLEEPSPVEETTATAHAAPGRPAHNNIATPARPSPKPALDRRVPWLAIVVLGGGVLAGLSYLGLRPTFPPPGKIDPRPATTTADNTPVPIAPAAHPSGQEPVSPPPVAEPQKTGDGQAASVASQDPPVAAPPGADISHRIGSETDRGELLRIAEAAPAYRDAVEERLLALGFLRLKSYDQTLWVRPGDGESFRECAGCPDMIALPAGSFRMGSPSTEAGRQEDEDDTAGPGGQPVTVTIMRPFAIGRYEVTRAQFAAFIEETGYKVAGGCYVREGGRQLRPQLSWSAPGFAQNENHPVACVSWEDADSYAQWLGTKTGNTYRLLTEAEWEYAARGGSAARFSFGDEAAGICEYGNGADQTAGIAFPDWTVAPCRDGFPYTAPAGTFKPNPFGLYDMHGNLWEWVADCQSDSLRHLSSPDAAGGARPACTADTPRVLRGGSWSDPPERLRSAARIAGPPTTHDQIVGFRIGRSLEPGK
jgi:formylglycine-generating enzyme required for sulfatase activity